MPDEIIKFEIEAATSKAFIEELRKFVKDYDETGMIIRDNSMIGNFGDGYFAYSIN